MVWWDLAGARSTLDFRRAGLGVARTTVGRRLQTMEDALGVRLFDRTPDGFVPTPAGEDLARVASHMEEEVHAAEARVMGRDAELQGTLRVSTVDFVYERFVGVFRSFVERHPGVQLTVSATNEQVSLRRREADVVVRLTDAPAAELVGRRLRTMYFAVYASRRLVERVGKGAALSAFPWLGDDERSADAWFDAWLAQHAPGARVVMRYESYPVLRESVRAGIGAHLLPCLEAEADSSLVAIAPEIEPFRRDLWALTLPELRANTRVRAFMRHLYEALHVANDG